MSGAPKFFFTWVGYCLSCKDETRLKSFAIDQQSSLVGSFVNYDEKSL
jgi:hypothetical protein